MVCRLEAFVHDPLINWRLLNTTDAADTTAIDAQLNSMQVCSVMCMTLLCWAGLRCLLTCMALQAAGRRYVSDGR